MQKTLPVRSQANQGLSSVSTEEYRREPVIQRVRKTCMLECP